MSDLPTPPSPRGQWARPMRASSAAAAPRTWLSCSVCQPGGDRRRGSRAAVSSGSSTGTTAPSGAGSCKVSEDSCQNHRRAGSGRVLFLCREIVRPSPRLNGVLTDSYCPETIKENYVMEMCLLCKIVSHQRIFFSGIMKDIELFF